MRTKIYKLSPFLLPLLLSAVPIVALSNDSHVDILKVDIILNNSLSPIFKFIDSNGRTTYSYTFPHDSTKVKEISINETPPDKYRKASNLINMTAKIAADALSKARKKREADRDVKEKKRLERLALVNDTLARETYQPEKYVVHRHFLWNAQPRHVLKHHAKPARKVTNTHPTILHAKKSRKH